MSGPLAQRVEKGSRTDDFMKKKIPSHFYYPWNWINLIYRFTFHYRAYKSCSLAWDCLKTYEAMRVEGRLSAGRNVFTDLRYCFFPDRAEE